MLKVVTGAIFLLGLSSILASGILFRHQRILTLLATAGILMEGQWLLLTLLDRTLLKTSSPFTVFLFGSIILFMFATFFYRQWRWPYAARGSGRRDAVIVVLLAITLAASWVVVRANGFQENEWVTHGFYNGDVATFAALIQRSLTDQGLVQENPFAANGPLEYPTLLHASFGTLFSSLGVGTRWLYVLPIMTLVQIFFTIPMFFLLWDVFSPEPEDQWRKWFGVPSRIALLALQGFIALYIMTVAWDNYIYPQSHFFLTGLFLLLAALLLKGFRETGWREGMMLTVASVIALLLLLSNAVTGTAAVAAVAVFYLLKSADRKREMWQRISYLLGVGGWIIIFYLFAPGNAALGAPGFSYTAALDMLRLAPAALLLLIGVLSSLSRQSFLAVTSTVLVGLGFLTFIFSTRNIIIENASRFFYHALLTSFPLFLSVILPAYYWIRRELVFTSHELTSRLAGWLAVAALFGFFALPAGASVLSAYDNLMFKDRQVVDVAMREALWWIEDNTAADAVFLAAPTPPFAIPMFTGRSLLRVDFWLSSNDVISQDVAAAFEGNASAQEQVVSKADYLLLTKENRALWEPLELPKVFDVETVAIYQLR